MFFYDLDDASFVDMSYLLFDRLLRKKFNFVYGLIYDLHRLS